MSRSKIHAQAVSPTFEESGPGKNPFSPAWWCPGAHAQTIFARFFRPFPNLKLSRKRLETPDGDFLDLDLVEGKTGAPLVLILHGLEGSSQAPYVRSLLGEIKKWGGSAAVLNFRSCSGEPNRVKETYHSGKTEDLDFIVEHFFKEKPGNKIFLAGYSIGGNIVLKWLGEQSVKAKDKVQKAVAISVPYHLAQSAELMDRGFNREVYTRKLLSTLRLKAQQKEKNFPGLVNQALVKKCRTFKIFDREVTARLNGFRDEMDYWAKSSSKHYLKDIQVETLLIHAEDDPFFPGTLLPFEDIRQNPHLQLLKTPLGGHLGFVSGTWPWQQDLWLEKTIMHFLTS